MKNIWVTKLNEDPIEWLLSSNTWTKYMTLIDLLEKSKESDEVLQVRKD
ncbi:hypothetical protein [Wukongibacter sp. M2B1]